MRMLKEGVLRGGESHEFSLLQSTGAPCSGRHHSPAKCIPPKLNIFDESLLRDGTIFLQRGTHHVGFRMTLVPSVIHRSTLCCRESSCPRESLAGVEPKATTLMQVTLLTPVYRLRHPCRF